VVSAKIWQSPWSIPCHSGSRLRILDDMGDRSDSACINDKIPESCIVSCDIPQSPNGLLNHLWIVRVEELDKQIYCALIDESLTIILISRGDVCDAPSGFELKFGEVHSLKELKELWDQIRINHSLNGWFTERKDPSKACNTQEYSLILLRKSQFNKFLEVVQLFINKMLTLNSIF